MHVPDKKFWKLECTVSGSWLIVRRKPSRGRTKRAPLTFPPKH